MSGGDYVFITDEAPTAEELVFFDEEGRLPREFVGGSLYSSDNTQRRAMSATHTWMLQSEKINSNGAVGRFPPCLFQVSRLTTQIVNCGTLRNLLVGRNFSEKWRSVLGQVSRFRNHRRLWYHDTCVTWFSFLNNYVMNKCASIWNGTKGAFRVA